MAKRKSKDAVTVTKTDTGFELTHRDIAITYRLMRRPRGYSFIDAPPFLHGVFVHADTAKECFIRYCNMILDREALQNNPLIDSGDNTEGTILDAKTRFGPPPKQPTLRQDWGSNSS